MIKRYDVIGCKITRITLDNAVRSLLCMVNSGCGGYICFANVHSTVTARNDADVLAALDKSAMTLPDGKPLYWIGKIMNLEGVDQISGPDFMITMLAQSLNSRLRHYFIGSTGETLERLVAEIRRRFPDVAVVGWQSPPFRALTADEEESIMRGVLESGADLVWVGLGAPKQELWMRKHAERLKPAVLLGVGAAFDFHAGRVRRAPPWARAAGFEWLYRLLREPRRLWKRYAITNAMFIFYLVKDLLFRRG
jgi:N-acetylglucosaminyldiphosphoundecaprenol N-acetyl-beta-D-mannosaminyltransferase